MSESVTQKHEMACGLACVSYISGKPYDELAQKQAGLKLNSLGYICPELVKLLKEHGKQYAWKKLPESERDKEFNLGDIVFVERTEELPYGHFLTKTSHGWMDPWINLSQDDNIEHAESGFREALPGRAEYLIYYIVNAS